MAGLAAPPPAWADPGTPYGQFRAGVPLDEIECRDGLVLMVTNSGRPACVGGDAAQRLEARGWAVVERATPEGDPAAAREAYLGSLQHGLVGEGEFTGELYGFDRHVLIRQPSAVPHSSNFGAEHYSFEEGSLSARQGLGGAIRPPKASETGPGSGTIDYREWIPSWIAPGYYLKWVDITQPDQQVSDTKVGVGRIKLTYVPRGLVVPETITDKEFVDTNMYLVDVFLAGSEMDLFPYSDEAIREMTYNGTATDIVVEDRWDGYVIYIHEGRGDPAKHGVGYDSSRVSISSGGNALTMAEHERIVTELFERYSAR